MDLGSRSYTYDALGELTNASDSNGQSLTMTYDPLSRPLSRTEKLANGTADLTTNWNWGATASSYNIGQLAGVSATSASGAYSEGYSFDNAGRLSTRTVIIPADASYTYGLSYNANTGLLDTLTYPVTTNGCQVAVQYGYTNGILSTLTDVSNATQCGSTGTVFWQASAENPRGQVTEETLGNHVVTNRAFDAVTGWLSSLQSGVNGGAALQNESYLFDQVGNLIQRQNGNIGMTENFYYDNIYRLYYSQLNGVTNLQMCYDNAGANCTENLPGPGNITSRSDVASGAAWTYDATHKHQALTAGDSSHTYSYDANGNALTRGPYVISWTSYNQPNTINTSAAGDGQLVQFDYDQNHLRWRTTYSSSAGVETTYLIGQLMEKVIKAGASDYRHYIYADRTKVAVYSRTNSANTVRYIREDHLGGVSGIINSDGTSYVKESFTAFGNRRSSCTWSGAPTSGQLTLMSAATRCGYTWQTVLGTMGLNDMNGRVEDAVTGRFLSPDPVVPDFSNTQDFNRYTYVNNNPLSHTDPSGFDADDLKPHPIPDSGGNPLDGGDPEDDEGPGDGYSGFVIDPQYQPAQCNISGCWTYHSVCVTSEGVCKGGWSYVGSGNAAGVLTMAYGSTSAGPGPDRNTNSEGKGGSSPQGNQLAELVVTAKKWLCTAGNFLAEGADKLGNVSGKLELIGLGTAGVGFVTAQPEVVAPGLALAATGGTGNIGAGVLQVTAGLLQGAGGGGFSNAGYGTLSLETGFTLARGIVGPPVSGYRTVSQRAADAFANSTATVAGGVNDFWTSLVDSASPQQVTCPGGK